MPLFAPSHKDECVHAGERWTRHISTSQAMKAARSGGKRYAGYCEVFLLLGRSRRTCRR